MKETGKERMIRMELRLTGGFLIATVVVGVLAGLGVIKICEDLGIVSDTARKIDMKNGTQNG